MALNDVRVVGEQGQGESVVLGIHARLPWVGVGAEADRVKQKIAAKKAYLSGVAGLFKT